jgi:hypothetical protein
MGPKVKIIITRTALGLLCAFAPPWRKNKLDTRCLILDSSPLLEFKFSFLKISAEPLLSLFRDKKIRAFAPLLHCELCVKLILFVKLHMEKISA